MKFGVLTAKNINIAVFRDANRPPKKALILTLHYLLVCSIYSWKAVEVVNPIYIIQESSCLLSCAAQVPYSAQLL
jgi:hypothetical protein